MADLVAMWGAATGSVALAVNLWKEARDRPRLRLTLQSGFDGDGGWVGLTIANTGRRAVAVVEAGLLVSIELEWSVPAKPDLPAQRTMPRVKLLDEPKAVVAGDVLRLRHPADSWPPPLLVPDFPLRPYAVDSFGRTTYGAAAPMLRTIMRNGWQPPPNVPPKQLVEHEMIEDPVVPQWQIWKPRPLRKPSPRAPTRPPTFTVG